MQPCSDCQIHFSCSCLTDSLIFSDTISSSPPAHRLSQDKSAATWTPAGHSVILSSSSTEYVSVSDTATTHYIFCVCVLLKMELKVGATLQSNPERLVKLVSVVGHNWAMTSSPEWFKIESRLWKAPFRPEWTTELFFWNSSLGFFFKQERNSFFPRKILFLPETFQRQESLECFFRISEEEFLFS